MEYGWLIYYCLLTVVLAGCDGVASPPDAVALFEIEATVRSTSVIVYTAVQVANASGAKVVSAGPQLNG